MASERPFAPVERATVSEQVRDDIHRRIVSGEIQPGSPLAAERVLAEQFGVARTSVREAIQGLVALGVIERRGNRSYVAERLPGSQLPEPDGGQKSLVAMLEAQHVLELCLFEMAASRATARERLEALALARRPAPATLEEFMIIDRQFHATVASSCGNPVLVEVYGRVLDALLATEAASELVLEVEPGMSPGEAIAQAGTEHLRIAEAFAAGEVEAMLEEAQQHIGPVAWERVGRAGRQIRTPNAAWEAWAAQRTVGS